MKTQIGEHETKFIFTNNRAQIIITWLQLRCEIDRLYAIGRVSSIYFDSPKWQLLNEKINSDFLKTKIRLRWYSDETNENSSAVSFIEVKNKIGSSRQKQRVSTGLSTDWICSTPLNDLGFIQVPDLVQRYTGIPTGTLQPAFQIDYLRHRFIDPVSGARLSIDFNIHVPRVNPRMMRGHNPSYLEWGVFEFKELSGVLPDWLHQLTALGCSKASFSKYSSCYAHLEQISF